MDEWRTLRPPGHILLFSPSVSVFLTRLVSFSINLGQTPRPVPKKTMSVQALSFLIPVPQLQRQRVHLLPPRVSGQEAHLSFHPPPDVDNVGPFLRSSQHPCNDISTMAWPSCHPRGPGGLEGVFAEDLQEYSPGLSLGWAVVRLLVTGTVAPRHPPISVTALPPAGPSPISSVQTTSPPLP